MEPYAAACVSTYTASFKNPAFRRKKTLKDYLPDDRLSRQEQFLWKPPQKVKEISKETSSQQLQGDSRPNLPDKPVADRIPSAPLSPSTRAPMPAVTNSRNVPCDPTSGGCCCCCKRRMMEKNESQGKRRSFDRVNDSTYNSLYFADPSVDPPLSWEISHFYRVNYLPKRSFVIHPEFSSEPQIRFFK